jgi:adenylate cyclase
MAIEVERKFLVANDQWRRESSPGRAYRQGYLPMKAGVTVRVRREQDRASITVKGPRSGIVRREFTFPIGLADADDMLSQLCEGRVLDKVRHFVPHDGNLWSVDIYSGRARGLVLAEIELRTEEQPFSLPAWVGPEVSHDPRYRNSNIARRRRWPTQAASPVPPPRLSASRTPAKSG